MVELDEQRCWYKTSETLWSSSTAIHGKVTLDSDYGELEDFFVSKLGVKSLTLEMVYHQLAKRPQTSSLEETVAAMRALSDFLQEERTLLDPSALRKAKIFPVKDADNTRKLCSADDDFAIADRVHLQERFQGRVVLLDLEMKDIQRLRPFFSWIELEQKFLSNSVRESTSVTLNSGTPVKNAGHDLCRKAYYILRYVTLYPVLVS